MKAPGIAALCLIAIAPLVVEAQQPGKPYRIGFLSMGTPATAKPFLETFVQRMRELGYAPGDYVFEARFAGDAGRLKPLAEELVARKPDILMGAFNPPIAALKAATPSIPIVMLFSGTPVEAGLVESLSRPGANVTGLAYAGPETSGKAFEALREAFPRARRILCLYESPFPGMERYVEASQRAAGSLGLTLVLAPVRSAADIEPSLARTLPERIEGIFVGVTALLYKEIDRVLEHAARERLPAVYTTSNVIDKGGLMSYAAITDHWPRAAIYVDRILRGAKPADLPIEQPTRYELVINLKAARAIGVSIPRSVLARADRVVE